MIKAGDLRHRVVIEQQVKTQDPTTGEMTIEWQPLQTVWAAVEPLSAREFMDSKANQSEASARVTIRHIDGIDATMRIVFRGKRYNIVGVLPDRVSGLEYLTLPVREGVNDGD